MWPVTTLCQCACRAVCQIIVLTARKDTMNTITIYRKMTETVNHATPISLVAKIVTFKANVTSAVKSTDLLVVYATTKTEMCIRDSASL